MTRLLLLVLVFTASFASGYWRVCPHQYGSFCYEISEEEFPNSEARWRACRGGELAEPSHFHERNYLAGLLKKNNLTAAWVEDYPKREKCPFKLKIDTHLEYKLDNGKCPSQERLFAICSYTPEDAPRKICRANYSAIENGYLSERCISSDIVHPGTILKVQCWTGYALTGPSEIICQNSGKWSELPICEPVCSESLLQGDGIKVYSLSKHSSSPEPLKYYKYKESAMIFCENGILASSTTIATHKVVTCVGSNKWSVIFPHCIPYKQISLSYSKRTQNVLEALNHSSLSIDCPTEEENSTKTWTKDQQSLSPSDKYFINEIGTLIIKDFTLEDEGHYTCSIQIPPSSFQFVSYDLRLRNKEVLFSAESLQVIRMKEGESKVLFCKDSSKFSRQNWYRNAILYFGTGLGSSITNDGALHLSNVSPLDNGLYICVLEYLVDGRRPAMTVTQYQVEIIPNGEGVCGQLFYAENYKGVVHDEDGEEAKAVEEAKDGEEAKDEKEAKEAKEEEYEEYEEEEKDCDKEKDGEKERSLFLEAHIPWFVSLFKKDEKMPFCYGTLISNDLIITAAQCFKNEEKLSNLVARIGFDPVDLNGSVYEAVLKKRKIQIHFVNPQNFTKPIKILNNETHFFIPYELQEDDVSITTILEGDLHSHLRDYDFKDLIIHPEYNGSFDNNLALIRLDQIVPVTNVVRPICLPRNMTFDDYLCTTIRIKTGSITTRGALASERVRKTRSKIVEITRYVRCITLVKHSLRGNMSCIEDPKTYNYDRKDFQGDLGSPLEVYWTKRYTLYGVHSSPQNEYLEVYTEIIPFMDWINGYL